MSTLVVRAPQAAKLWSPLRGLARIASGLLTVLEVFSEAQRQAYEAKQRYPFMSW
jgi:hypothetical protein